VLLGRESWVANPLQLETERLGSLYLDTAIGGGPAASFPPSRWSGLITSVSGTALDSLMPAHSTGSRPARPAWDST
jgi:hypothetical protein